MKQEEIVERLRKLTGSWESTFKLLDKYDIDKAEPAPCDFQLSPDVPQFQPKKADIIKTKEIKFSHKKVRIKRGVVRDQVLEIVQSFPDSNLSEIATLGDWQFHNQKHMKVGLQKNLTTLCSEKVLVRKKINGLYSYRMAEKK